MQQELMVRSSCSSGILHSAKRVVNNAVVNEVLSDAAVLHRQAKEIEELKKRLAGSG